jgi:hypothetical protein
MTMALLALCTTTVRAQQTQQTGAQPGATVLTAASPDPQAGTDQTPVDNSTPPAGQVSTPTQTMTPISGVQVLAPSFGGDSHDFVLPALGCADHADTNPTGYEKHASLFSETTCAASLTLQRVGRNTQFNLEDAGGAFFFAPNTSTKTDPNAKQYGAFDELGVSAEITGRRWKWILGDQGMYLPESPMGFPGFAGVASYGAGMGGSGTSTAPAFNSAFQPNQGIYSGLTSRVSDLAETEVQYIINARSTVTASGMFGTLQSLSPGFLDDDSATFMVGYNRFFGRGDVAALTYVESHYVFSGDNPGIATRGVSFLYGHTFSPKLSVQLSVAPMENVISEPQGGTLTRFFMSTFDSLDYRDGRWDTQLRFQRGTTEGAGVLAGSARNTVQGSAGREFWRKFHAAFQASYSRNQSITLASMGATSYDYVQGGLNLSREFGPHISMYLNYQAQRQVSNAPICLNANNCSTVFIQQVLGAGFSWHARALNVE